MQVRAQEERHEKTGTEGEGPVVGVGETIYQEPPERSALLWNINKQISSDLVARQY